MADGAGSGIPGASVTGDWEFQPVGGAIESLGGAGATTDSVGEAWLAPSKKRANSGDLFLFTVKDVAHPTGNYVETTPTTTASAAVAP